MTLKEIEELNNHPIDWCYNCAKANCKTMIQKMFAWIVCFLMKNDNVSYRFSNEIWGRKVRLTLIVDTRFVLNENEAISSGLYVPSNWNFLKEIAYKHITETPGIQYSKELLKALLNPKIKIENEKVLVIYNC